MTVFCATPLTRLTLGFHEGCRLVGRELSTETGDKSEGGSAGSVAVFPTGNSAMLFHSSDFPRETPAFRPGRDSGPNEVRLLLGEHVANSHNHQHVEALGSIGS